MSLVFSVKFTRSRSRLALQCAILQRTRTTGRIQVLRVIHVRVLSRSSRKLMFAMFARILCLRTTSNITRARIYTYTNADTRKERIAVVCRSFRRNLLTLYFIISTRALYGRIIWKYRQHKLVGGRRILLYNNITWPIISEPVKWHCPISDYGFMSVVIKFERV